MRTPEKKIGNLAAYIWLLMALALCVEEIFDFEMLLGELKKCHLGQRLYGLIDSRRG
jgi:hypothetical protein